MKIFLLRHADAIYGLPDADRTLSQKGVEQMQSLMQHIKPSAVSEIESIWHSPLLRAKQTAELFAQHTGLNCPMETRNELIPGGSIQSLANKLETLHQDTLLVGHNPHMEALTSFLLKRSSHPSMIHFRKAGIACIEYSSHPDQSWILQWYAFPSLFSQ